MYVFFPTDSLVTRITRSRADFFIVGGTGLFACQLAKNVFKAGRVITTVSTAKVPKVKELLGEGVVDESEYLQRLDP